MKITEHSRNRFYETLTKWDVPREYADRMFEYFVLGLQPGSFYTAVLSNDFAKAMQHSHPANSIPGLKALVGWLQSTMLTGMAWGGYIAVKTWLAMSDVQRRQVLEEFELIYSEQDEILLLLKDEPTREPFFYN